MINRFFFCFIFLYSFLCFSQEHIVGGILVDTNDDVIAYANIVLIDSEGVKPTTGITSSESGIFIVEDVIPGNYILKISYLGYRSYSKDILVDSNIDLGVIHLDEDIEELEGVTIIAKRPTVKRYVDRLVFNVENSTLSNNNVLDVLKHTPGVLVTNGEITIKQSTPIIYMNDRRVYLSSREIQQLLEGTSATNVKSIEVITNPPAKYDAEGGAVLNIITSKNIIVGYNGSVFGNYKQGSKYPKYSLGTNHFFKTKKLTTYFNYNISPRKDYINIRDAVNFIDSLGVVSSWNTNNDKTRKTTNQIINTNIDYEVNDKSVLSFTTSMLLAPREGVRNDVKSFTEVFGANKILDSTFNTVNQSIDETYNLAFTLNYALKLKRDGEKISFNIHNTNYDYSMFQDVDTNYNFPDGTLIRNNRFQTFSSQKVDLYTGQTDYTLPLSVNENFEAGLKFSKINSESKLTQYLVEDNQVVEDINNSDIFLYQESNYAAYSSYSKDWDAWSLKSGLRFEYSDIKGNSLSTNSINNNDYIKLFPSLHLLHNLNENSELYFKYNKRIYRPRYSQLNPFKYFLNDNAYVSGDPDLKPRIDDIFILGYTFKNDYTFELYYRYEKNPAIQVMFQDNNDNKLIYKHTNIDRSISYGIDFTTYTKLSSQWSLYVLSSFYYYDEQFFALESNNELISNDKWSTYIEISNYFTFLEDKTLTADISYLFISETVDGPTNVSSRSGLDINIKKTFWNNKASISIGVTDVFNNQNEDQSTKYLNQDVLSKFRPESRLIAFGFNYKFGNFRLKTSEKNIKLIERDRLNQN